MRAQGVSFRRTPYTAALAIDLDPLLCKEVPEGAVGELEDVPAAHAKQLFDLATIKVR